MTTNVLISGASIAGPALAHWLCRGDFAVTVVERAPGLRPGGQAVDLRGPGKEVARRMGLDAAIRAACTDTRGMSFVNKKNRTLATMTADMFDGDGMIAEIEILRGDLAQVLYDATREQVTYRFGDQIAALREDADGVRVEFASGAVQTFDLVVGADGLHSGVRALAFGPEDEYLTDLGHLLAFFTVPNHLGLESWMVGYGEPNTSAAIRSIRDGDAAMALLSVTGTRADFDRRDQDSQKALLRTRMGQMDWEVPWLLDRMDEAGDFVFDSCSQVHMPSWSTGRVVLLGDAAHCASPISGQGTTLAMIGAYVLAGELSRAGGDHTVAFGAYERILRDYVHGTQQMGVDNARHFAAKSRLGLAMQYLALRALRYLPGKSLIMRKMLATINAIDLPAYPALVPAAA